MGGEESCERKWRSPVPPTGCLNAKKSLLPGRDVFAASDFGAAQRCNGTFLEKAWHHRGMSREDCSILQHIFLFLLPLQEQKSETVSEIHEL